MVSDNRVKHDPLTRSLALKLLNGDLDTCLYHLILAFLEILCDKGIINTASVAQEEC